MKQRLLVRAGCAALAAFVVGVFLIRTVRCLTLSDLAAVVLSGGSLTYVLLSTRRLVRQLAEGQAACTHARHFQWSCGFISMLSLGFGMAVSAVIYSADFTRAFGVVWFGALTCAGAYPVYRDAKRLADTVEPGEIGSDRRDQGATS